MAYSLIKEHQADVAIILGSGLNAISDAINIDIQLPYQDIPNLLGSEIKGHSGLLTLGRLNGLKVACFQGRPHWYEGVDGSVFLTMMKLPKMLGCKQIIVTNAAGAINDAYAVGDVVLIRDHINLQGKSPLMGLKPPAFVGMDVTYDATLREHFTKLAHDLNMSLHQGVYTGVLGPNFETPSEIQAMKRLGGDVVGMSTIPEVIAARYYEMDVCALSVISNMAAGISETALSHEVTLQGAQKGCQQLASLIHHFCRERAS